MSDGTQKMSLAEALASAKADSGEATPGAADTGTPPVEANAEVQIEQATVGAPEQPTAEVKDGFSDEATALADSLLSTDDGDTQNGSGSGITPGSDEFWNLQVDVKTVNGPQAVTIQELSDGYLRQADYTQKTQSLAEQKKSVETAIEFRRAFESDPAGFINSLAVQAGLIEEGAVPAIDKELVSFPSQEDLDAKLASLVEERIAADPRVQTAEVAAAQAQLDGEFVRLEKEYGIPLSPALREDLIKEAVKVGSADLEGLLARRLVKNRDKQLRADATGLAATSRPGSQPSGSELGADEKTAERPSMREAWQESKVAAAQQ